MSEGHGGDGGACDGHGGHVCAEPVAGPAEAVNHVYAPRIAFPVVNGVEVNRARILEKSHQGRIGNALEGNVL